MTVLAGKYEVHFAPISCCPINITLGVKNAKVMQGDELITIVNRSAISDMVRAIKRVDETVEIEMR